MAEQLSLSERLAVESANGTLNTTRTPVLPAIPSIGDDVASMRKALQAIKQLLDAREARASSVMDKSLSLRDLLNAGAITISIGNDRLVGDLATTVVSGSGGITIEAGSSGYSDTRPVYTTPPTATNLEATGAFRTVIVTWDLIDYRNHSYTEIWRASVDNLGSAALIGTSTANIYDDASGVVGATYYYWVRAVNIEGAFGAYNAVSGVSAALLQVGNADLAALSVEAAQLAAGSVEAVHLAANSIAVGNIAIENGAINNAAIANLAVDTAKIADLAVSTAKIADLAVSTAKIADLTVTEAKIVDLAVGTAKIGNAAITNAKIGDLEVNDAKIASLDGSKITADSITANKILITGRGAALNDDPAFQDTDAWVSSSGVTFTTVTDGVVGNTVLRSTAGYGYLQSRSFPVTAGKVYRLQFWARPISGVGGIWVRFHRLDGTGSELAYYSGFEVVTPVGSWVQYSNPILPEATTTTGYLTVEFNYPADTASMEIQDLRLEEQVSASLIVEGTITTDRLVANAATVAAASSFVGSSTGFSAVTSVDSADTTVVTLSSTGQPVTMWAVLNLGVQVTSGAPSRCQVTVNERLDAATMRSWSHYENFTLNSGVRNMNTEVPLLFRTTPAAGSHDYGFFVQFAFKDDTGASISSTGTYTTSCYMVVTENKV